MLKKLLLVVLLLSGAWITSCGSNSDSDPTATTYTIGGTVTGLSGTVVLQNNAGDDLSLTADGAFTFATAVADGAAYAVTVLTQPTGQSCTASSGTGTVNDANITSVAVTCVDSNSSDETSWTEQTLSWADTNKPVTSTCTITLADGSYRMYFTGAEGIYNSTSTDGLVWSSAGISLSTIAATNPSVIELTDGTYLMIYGKQTSAPITERLFRATSPDGIVFTDQPGLEPEGAILIADPEQNDFVSVPDMIYFNDTTIRMYFVSDTIESHIHTATSTDNGETWTKEGSITLNGSYGGQTNDPDIVILPDGSYKLYFTTPPEGTAIADLRLRSATSTNGLTFTVETGEIQAPSDSTTSILDPDTILITGTSTYMCYYGTEPAGDLHAILSPE